MTRVHLQVRETPKRCGSISEGFLSREDKQQNYITCESIKPEDHVDLEPTPVLMLNFMVASPADPAVDCGL